MSKTAGVTAVKDGKITNEAIGLIQRKANDACRRVQDGTLSLEDVLRGFQQTLEGGQWPQKTLEIGTFKTASALREALEDTGVYTDYYLCGGLPKKMPLTKTKQTTDLVTPLVRELGFPEGEKRKRFLKKVSHEVGTCVPPKLLRNISCSMARI